VGKKEAGKGKSTSPDPNSLVALDAVFLVFVVARNTTA